MVANQTISRLTYARAHVAGQDAEGWREPSVVLARGGSRDAC